METKAKIDVVIPTYNRLWALRKVVDFYLGCDEIGRLIVVDDCSDDGTEQWLKIFAKEVQRLVFIRHGLNRGASAARNTGANVATAPYVFFADDDMLPSPNDGLLIMLQEMITQKADIIAPVHIYSESDAPKRRPDKDSSYSGSMCRIFNRNTLELYPRKTLSKYTFRPSFFSPLACGLMLMRRDVLSCVRYDESLGRTSYRDETDFQLKAIRKGFRLIVCTKAVLIDFERVEDKGGCHTLNYAKYEWEACRNNWKILNRHRDIIRNRLKIRAPILFLQACFIVEHIVNRIARCYIRLLLNSMGLMRNPK